MGIGSKLYKTFQDGKIQHLANEDPAQVMNAIIRERKLPFEFSRSYHGDIKRFSLWGEDKKPNEEMLKRVIPENYELHRNRTWGISHIPFYGENYLHDSMVKTDDVYRIRIDNKETQWSLFGIYNDDTGEWIVEPYVANGSYYPYPTNDKNIWYLQLHSVSEDERYTNVDEKKERLYNSETGEIYSPQVFQLIQISYGVSGYPGEQIVYMGYYNR
jgi:hypothetical protein